MRVLIISDLHGNLAALEAVAAVPHDAVICLGDIVGYGPQPAACLAWVRANAALTVQGNHDYAFGCDASPRCSGPFRLLSEATTPMVRAQLTMGDRRYLADLPRWAFNPYGASAMCVHATPADPLFQYLPSTEAAWGPVLDGLAEDLLFVGHTHDQFTLTVRDRRVVNPGSVGQPKDGDPRAHYALIEDGRISLHRAAYDVERTVEALRAAVVPAQAVDELSELLRTGRVPAAALARAAAPAGETLQHQT